MVELQLNLYSLVYFLGAIQGFFLTFLFMFKQNHQKENLILAILMFVYAVFLLESALLELPLSKFSTIIITIAVGVQYAFGPLHYLYAWSMIHGHSNLSKKHLLHFIPFVIVKYYMYMGFFTSDLPLIEFLQNPDQFYNPIIMVIIEFGLVFQGIIYMVITLLLLQKYGKEIRNEFSTLEKINLNWLKNITFLTSCVWGIVLVVHILEVLYLFQINVEQISQMISVSTAIFVYMLGYFGFIQPHIPFDMGEKYSAQKETPNKYVKTRLEDHKAQNYLLKLQNYMTSMKPYLDPNITLSRLSKDVEIPEHHLSQVINDRMNQNFFQFINNYRVNEVKEQLINPDKQYLSILGIAFESGFNSKSSFNTIFKNMTQQTPSQYQKKATS